MSDKNPNHDLLADVLAEEAPADFRGVLLDATLRQVRGRRRLRRSRTVVAAVVVAGALALIVSRFGPQAVPTARPAAKGYQLVTTRPLPPEAMVHTQPFDLGRLVASTTTVPTVHTPRGGSGITLLDDRQLLALAGEAHPAVLVRIGPQAQRLVFVKSEDQNGFSLP
jgi:hypothetical protein